MMPSRVETSAAPREIAICQMTRIVGIEPMTSTLPSLGAVHPVRTPAPPPPVLLTTVTLDEHLEGRCGIELPTSSAMTLSDDGQVFFSGLTHFPPVPPRSAQGKTGLAFICAGVPV